MRGAVSQKLAQELEELFRRPALWTWVDPERRYEALARALARRTGHHYQTILFEGSWIEWLLALEGRADDLAPPRLLLYLPGLSREQARKTPALELMLAGDILERDLPALIEDAALGWATPDALRAFLATAPSLEDADAWLDRLKNTEHSDLQRRLDAWSPEQVFDKLLGDDSEIANEIKLLSVEEARPHLAAIWSWMGRNLGTDEGFAAAFHGQAPDTWLGLIDTLAAWLMCVEFVHDLRRAPLQPELAPLRALPAGMVRACQALARRFRERVPDLYAELAAIVEGQLAPELSQTRAEDLGNIETFRQEEQAILEAALQALSREDWASALGWAAQREREPSFWVRRDLDRRLEWSLVAAIAALGQALAAHPRPLHGAPSWPDAVTRYVELAAPIDRAHRHLEQLRALRLKPHLSAFAALLSEANQQRERHRAWADRLCADFLAVGDLVGFSPPAPLQQRRAFEDRLWPLAQDPEQRTAVFALDALRYELAEELREQLAPDAAHLRLDPLLAELPSIGPIGHNALAPTQRQGRLTLAGDRALIGFRVGEWLISGLDQRLQLLRERLVDPSATQRRALGHYTLDELCERPLESLRAGHGGKATLLWIAERADLAPGPDRFQLADAWLGQLVAAVRRLRQLGFQTFVFTSAQGALRRDDTALPLDAPPNATLVERRFALCDAPADDPALLSLSLKEIGYEGRAGYLVVPRGTGYFRQANADQGVLTGGASPQERVVPFLVMSQRPLPAQEQASYEIEGQVEATPQGFCARLRLRPAQAQRVLGFVQTAPVRLALRAQHHPEVQVQLSMARGAEIELQALKVHVHQEVEVWFELSGPVDRKVRLEVELAQGEPARLARPWCDERFLQVRGQQARPQEEPARAAADGDWAASFDEHTARALRHLERYGVLTEAELIHMLGGARAARRFAMSLGEAQQRLPFHVRVEVQENGKCYTRG
jgi:hypothetical protein